MASGVVAWSRAVDSDLNPMGYGSQIIVIRFCPLWYT